jgi:hypothetical protein
MSSLGSTHCVACHDGELRPTWLRITLTSDGQSHAVDDDALVCDTCGDELIGEREAAFLLTARAPSPTCGDDGHRHAAYGDRVKCAPRGILRLFI